MLEPGTILRNRYEIKRRIGRGGMAEVYLAFDRRRMVQVAIKVLREDLAEDPEFLRRFTREARALAQLDHPNIVRFYSFERQGTIAFIVMDYVEGKTLRKRLLEADGPLPLEEVTHILRQVAAALQFAHNEGYIHRDVKPGNILIRHDGTALLSDFGIARAAETATMTMGAIGSPAYMSPEQIRGEELTPQSDLYSLGIVLFEMVTGRRPFTGEGGTGSGSLSRLRRIEQQQLHDPPPDPRRWNPSLPEAAVRVIMRALEKHPDGRWPDAASMVKAWEDALQLDHAALSQGRILSPPAGPPITPTRPDGTSPSPERSRRLWVAGGVVGSLVVVLLVLGITFARPGFSPTPTPSPAPLAQVVSTPTATPAPTIDVEQAAKATAEAILTATASMEAFIATQVAETAEAVEATITKEALIAQQTQEARLTATARVQATRTAIARKTATKRARITATARARATATARAKATATAQAKAKKRRPPSKPKTSRVRCFEARRRHWEKSPVGAGEIAGIVYDLNGRPFNQAQVHLYIKASNWETYLPIAPDGIYHFCCLAFSLQNLHVVELTGPNIKTVQTYEFYINNPNLNKVLVDFYQVPCR